ncbi:MAG: signal peptidase I [Bacillota bacterium]|jgi:signal peptidase I
MAKEIYRDFMGDEKLEELQDKLAEAKIKSEKHRALDEQSKANLNLFEKITTDSAIKLAECQSQLADLTHKLDEEKAELARQTDLMNQQEMVNKAKAYTLQAAQKELEESQLRYCKTIENVNKLHAKISEYENAIEKAGIQVKSAYNNWQHNYNHLQEQKLASEKNSRTVEQLQAQIANLSHQQEVSKNQAADLLADTVILNLNKDLDITDLHLEELPKATVAGSAAIPEIPPIDDELAKLIREATNDTDSEYSSLRPQTPENQQPDPIFSLENTDEQPVSEQPEDTEKSFWGQSTGETSAAKEVFADLKIKKTQSASDEKTQTDNNDQTAEQPKPERTPAIPETPATVPNGTETSETEPETKEQTAKKKKHPFLGYIICIILAIAIAFLLKTFVFQITEISGDSMEPTLTSGERTISTPISYYFDEAQQFDIIVFEAPDRTDGAYYVKRIIGLPGDHVVISDGQVTVNGEILPEDYLNDAETLGEIDTLVPNGEYFVMGDNRAVSHDSRNPDVGTIGKDTILGKIVYQIYPFNSIGKIE